LIEQAQRQESEKCVLGGSDVISQEFRLAVFYIIVQRDSAKLGFFGFGGDHVVVFYSR